MARIPNISDLSFVQLQELQYRIEVALAARRAEEAAEVKAQMAAFASSKGFSVNEVLGGKRGGKRGPAAIKYRNPKNPDQTWTGRGRKPIWLVEQLKKGAKIDSFAV